MGLVSWTGSTTIDSDNLILNLCIVYILIPQYMGSYLIPPFYPHNNHVKIRLRESDWQRTKWMSWLNGDVNPDLHP